MRRKARQSSSPQNKPRFWGRHPVAAALANPERRVRKIWGTREAVAALGPLPVDLPVTLADVADLARLVPGDAPHQGLVAEVDPLEDLFLADILMRAPDDNERATLLLLDQVTDPHNVGAILRSAAAFGATGVVVPSRRSAGMTAGAWKSSAGAAVRVPVARAANLARALQAYKDAGLMVVGLDAGGDVQLPDLDVVGTGVCLVVGSEGEGLSRLVRDLCDTVVTRAV